MKKIIYICFISIILGACTLERYPEDQVLDTNITSAQYQSLLNGCYAQIKGWSDVMHRVREYPADNIVIRGSSTDAFYSFISYLPIADNGRLSTYWNNSYKLIFQASGLIEGSVEGSSATIDQQLGELYYLRALCYFYMCNTWGRPYYQDPDKNLGVPVVNGAHIELVTELPDRSSVKKVYEQVISDLEKAEQLMTINKSAAYATKEAAQALLSRVYLYMGGTFENPDNQYNDLSIAYAGKVISSGRYTLLNYEDFQKSNTLAPDNVKQTETIFAIKYTNSDYPGTSDYYYNIGGMYGNIKGMGWGEMYASAKYLNLLKESSRLAGRKDARSTFIWPQYTLNDNGDTLYTPAFRFIAPTYNETSGQQSGYEYKQFPLDLNTQGEPVQPYQFTETVQGASVTYPLTPVIDNDYSVTYKGSTYVGEKDYMMRLNRVYPMWYITKCSLQDGYAHLHSPVISRLAEIYLNMAEAYVKKGDYANALTYLNKVRERATNGVGYTTLDASNAKELVTRERQLELAFEAHRTMDVFRNGETMVRQYPGPHAPLIEYPATSTKVVQLIPQSEINAYPGTLTQNPL